MCQSNIVLICYTCSSVTTVIIVHVENKSSNFFLHKIHSYLMYYNISITDFWKVILEHIKFKDVNRF